MPASENKILGEGKRAEVSDTARDTFAIAVKQLVILHD